MTKPQFPLQDQLRGFSKALFSTWLYHKRFNILFDAGEGVSTGLLNRVFGIRRIFLSHGHADHIAGLINLANIRNLGAGDQTALLQIFHPKGNSLVETVKNYLAQTQSSLSFPLEWIPVEPDEIISLDERNNRIFVRTFKTRHSQCQLSLGYNVIETRRRLFEQFQGMSQLQINEAIRELGKDKVSESFQQIVFTYGGDSRPIAPDLIRNSLFLCHECTYMTLDDDERCFHQHSVLDETLSVAATSGAKNLLLFHLSLRYSLDEVKKAVFERATALKLEFSIMALFGDRIHPIYMPPDQDYTNDETVQSDCSDYERKG